ncbi:MAG: hypothetical protein A2452_13450 [Candidatus Firestonebacteria bacterium RIFOXYC2_FULL_39_67]|nr:MAG: hypothetical protein A2536_05300 [Candidatus Firestonebacteria bacterium RIFOXYD2_FULL_39_29]OGF56212.1 MAG: hypothetical protein A2452_13450 [Candidatus Firestonebacteria bacterium RIFOXYC2_FULL_39_67]OGF57291.1 MAG: hypothetical protein A2497_03680 [Candidatus Firestonebacteria bacterium RifOxyC12_full_39_7]
MNKIVKNIISTYSSNVINKFMSFALLIIIARKFDVLVFGLVSFATVFIDYFSVLASLGIESIAIRNLSKNRSLRNAYYSNVLILRIVLSILALILIIVSALIIGYKDIKLWLILLYGVNMFLSAFNVNWIFSSHEKLELTAASRTINNIVMFGVLMMFLRYSTSILMLPIMQIFSTSITIVMEYIIYIRVFGRLKYIFKKKLFAGILRSSIPIGISTILIKICNNSSILFLSFMTSDLSVGLYNAAFRLIYMIQTIADLFFVTLYPTMSNLVNKIESFEKVCSIAIKIMAIVALPIFIGGLILADKIILHLYGTGYINSVLTFRLLLVYLLTSYIGGIFGYVIMIKRKESTLLKMVFINSVLNVLLNLILIPKYGIEGAAISTIVPTSALFFFWLREYRKVVNTRYYSLIKLPAIAAIIMGIFLYFINIPNLYVSILVGFLIYSITIYCFGELKVFLELKEIKFKAETIL